VEGYESPVVHISVLDSSGRYLLASGRCCGVANLSDYPAGASCTDYAEPPPGWAPEDGGMDYPRVFFQWMSEGMPGSWDADGDGRPCENHWSPAEIDEAFRAAVQP
jgi:hypothetical protein